MRCFMVALLLVSLSSRYFFRPTTAFAVRTLSKSRMSCHDDDSVGSSCSSLLELQATTETSTLLEDRKDEFDLIVGGGTNSASLPSGATKGFVVTKTYDTSSKFDLSKLEDTNEIKRLHLSETNVTLPVALYLLDPETYPSITRARKACRKGNILIEKWSELASAKIIDSDQVNSKESAPNDTSSLSDKQNVTRIRGRVGDRVVAGDLIGHQVRQGTGYFPALNHKKPPFDLPIVYQDDHIAIVHKPAGIVTYRTGKDNKGAMAVRTALPFCLEPPKFGVLEILRRPASVHRLDKATSGVLVVAKTKPALVSMSRQFHDRVVKKTYFAIVNGIPEELPERRISLEDAKRYGISNADSNSIKDWQRIDSALEEQDAVTLWRVIKYVPSLHAHNKYLTLVELKPQTGRYHQLRRHMAWVCKCPLVGDKTYDGGSESAQKFRERGLFLCAQKVELRHPDPEYIIAHGQFDTDIEGKDGDGHSGTARLYKNDDGSVKIVAEIALPDKFESLLRHEEERYRLLNNDDTK